MEQQIPGREVQRQGPLGRLSRMSRSSSRRIGLRHPLIVLVIGAGLLAAACGSDEEPTSATSTTSSAVPAVAVDWEKLGSHDLGSGWTLRDAEGDAPIVEILEDGRLVGSLEVVSFPLATLPEVTAARRDGGAGAALAAHASSFFTAIREDRRAGCGSDYRFRPDEPETVELLDGAAIRYGFTGGVTGAEERTVQWAGIRGDALVILSVPAYDPGSCLGTEGAELDVATLERLERRLTAAVERGALPTATLR